MDKLIPAIMTRLDDDSELAGYVGEINLHRNPPDPKALTKPLVVVRAAPGEEEVGLHGAAENVSVEVKIWGYGHSMTPDAYRAGRRIIQLFLAGFRVANGGLTFRFRSVAGWQTVDDTDPLTLHLQNSFTTRYWSEQRISTLTA